MIAIIDYGLGNLGSIFNMLSKIGIKSVITSDSDAILRARKLILPGVGSFDNGMENLASYGLIPVLKQKVISDGTPVLGICLGMQLLTRKSEEGRLEGLGWINAETKRFRFEKEDLHLKIPHMGWNSVLLRKKSELFDEGDGEKRFYFVHSYHVVCCDESDVLTETYHGYAFASSIIKENIIGVQFHPEKSHKFGMQLLRNFAERF